MLLKVQEYKLEVVFKPGSEIPVADTLSRAPTCKPIYTEVVAANNISITSIKEDKLDETRGATLKDDTLKVLGDMILSGWLNEKQHVPEILLPYFRFRNELVVHTGIVVRVKQIVIPVCLQESMKKKLQIGHYVYKLTPVFVVLEINIREDVEKCGICSKYQDKQPSESLYVHETPELPW